MKDKLQFWNPTNCAEGIYQEIKKEKISLPSEYFDSS